MKSAGYFFSMVAFLCIVFGLTSPVSARSTFVGMVKVLEGEATVLRQGETLPVQQGMKVSRHDVIKTVGNSVVGLVFSDDTRITLGPGTQIVVDDYWFEPREAKMSFAVKILKGTMSFLSGQIAKLSPASVRVMTPSSTIGVRGTHILARVQ